MTRARHSAEGLRGDLTRLPKRHLVDWLVERSREDNELRGRLCDLARTAGQDAGEAAELRAARRDLREGRAALALDRLDRFAARQEDPAVIESCLILRGDILLALGRRHEAFDAAWSAFCRTLSGLHWKKAVALAPARRRMRLEQEALQVAEDHPDADLALGYLITRGALDRATSLIEHRFPELSSHKQAGLEPVADVLSDTEPRQSWELLRLTLQDILEKSRRRFYDQAIKLLQQMERLSERGGFAEEHRAFVDQLRHEHAGKAVFWRDVDSRGPAARSRT